MPTEVIKIESDTISCAAEDIIGNTDTGDVIYFNGFFGLGASAVLKAVVEKLKSSLSDAVTGKARGVDKIVHIDCSLWLNKRALQKAIAAELGLPPEVMALFSQWDKEDDFDGVEKGVRGVIPSVRQLILDDLQNRRFLVVFHNGSGNYIDLREFGVPVIGLMSKRVLWTSQGKLWLHHKGKGTLEEDAKEFARSSDVAICWGSLTPDLLRSLLYADAKEIAEYTDVLDPDTSPKIIMECILYRAQRGNDNCIDWGTHASNYFVCDGIIQASTDGSRSAWEIGEALQRNMNFGWHEEWMEVLCLALSEDVQWGWTSMENNAPRILETSVFSSPPFSSCNSLRFLLLDHCKDKDATVPAVDCSGEGEHHDRYKSHDRGACFRKLWVLHLSFTDWHWLLSEDAMDLMAELRELNVMGVTNWSISHMCRSSGAERNTSCRLRNLVTLRVTAKPTGVDRGVKNPTSLLVAFPDLSSSIILKKVVLDGCVKLEELGLNALPPSLESFSFTSTVNTNIKRMCFRGCTKLDCVLLKGQFGNLVELDMSGTTVRSLDLSATQAPKLSRLFLLGCEKLSAILWPPQERGLDVLHIDTTQVAWSRKDKSTKEPRDDMIVGSSSAIEIGCSRAPPDFDVYIVLRDARLFRSLLHARVYKYFHIEISTIAAASNVVSVCGHKGSSQATKSSTTGGARQVRARSMRLQKLAGNFYADITNTFNDCSQEIMWMWPCPVAPTRSWDGMIGRCNISTEDKTWIKLPHGTASTKQGGTRATTLPDFVHDKAFALHLHDSFSITCIPGTAPPTKIYLNWNSLRWCRLERFPNLEDSNEQEGRPRAFLHLECIHLHELPKLQRICGHRMYAPNLKTVNIRGCWSLKRLPAVRRRGNDPLPEVDCEKEWGAGLEWDGEEVDYHPSSYWLSARWGKNTEALFWENEASFWDKEELVGHHPSLYKASHSQYHRKPLLKASVLR
ncbi:hypothetical protein ACP4OV_029043 [Aristida adscensionis]